MAGRMPKYDAVLSEVLPDKGGFKNMAKGAVWESDGTNPKAPELNGKLYAETELIDGKTTPKPGTKVYSISFFSVERRQKKGA